MSAARRRVAAPRLAALLAAAAVLAACGGATAPSGSSVSAPSGGSGAGVPSGSASVAAGPSAAGSPRPLTFDEANRLAVMRFRLYQGRGARVSVTGIGSSAGPLSLIGDVDYRAGIGYATIAGGGVTALVQWDRTRAVFWPGAGQQATEPPASPPATAVPPRALDASTGAIDAVLLILLQLGQDRPDNAQLLQRNGAAWVRSDVVDGVPVDVFDGPHAPGATTPAAPDPSVQYWVDAQGAPRQVGILLSGGRVTVDLQAGRFRAIERSPSLPTGVDSTGSSR